MKFVNKICQTLCLAITVVALSAFGYSLAGSWNIASDFSIKFSGKSTEGTFNDLKGTVVFDSVELSLADMDVQVATNTISTGNSTKDKHARGTSWFDVEKYPKIKFKSTCRLPIHQTTLKLNNKYNTKY